jgi:PAS domain S-box-containing protein
MIVHLNGLLAPRRWLGMSLAMWLFIGTTIALPIVLSNTLESHTVQESLRQARAINGVIAVVRDYYASSVVGPLLGHRGSAALREGAAGMPTDGRIPIPATMTIELGQAIGAADHPIGARLLEFHFVSDAPFLGRQRAPLDAFEAEALRHFRGRETGAGAEGAPDFWRIEQRGIGETVVRLAMPVRMEAACVACHNSHPDSPVRSWRVGDVRGIQEVLVGFDAQGQIDDSRWLTLYLLLFGATAMLALREHRVGMSRLRELNAEIDESRRTLLENRAVLEQTVRDLGTKTTVLDKAPFGILVLDPAEADPTIRYANDAFCLGSGYPQTEVLGRHPRFVFGADTEPQTRDAIEQALRERQTLQIETTSETREGSSRRLSWLIFPCYAPAGELLSMVVCLTDITGYTRAEEERRRLAAELQESSRLESLALTIAGVAHDLNTPIGIAVTSSSHIAHSARELVAVLEAADADPVRARTLAERIRRAAEIADRNLAKTAQLMDGFRQTSADVSRDEWRAVRLHDLLESLALTLSPLMKRAQCQLRLTCPATLSLTTNPGALARAISNLLVNATVHAFEGRDDRRVSIDVDADEHRVRIVVADNGNGMSEEAAMRAFEPFYTTRRASGGSGLGLFSCRRAIEQQLGGRIELRTRRGHGTEFTLELPRGPKPADDLPTEPAA